MKVMITINCDNDAFRGADCGNELSRILRALPDLCELESKSTIARRHGANPKGLRDINGNTVGKLLPRPSTTVLK
jgi:hypothetical protein